jgi:vacuolar-type H+-ATPase subunit F/Vma7
MLGITRRKADEKSGDQQTEPKLPRATQMPAPPTQGSPGRRYDQQALNFAQRIIDNEADLERLRLECDQWRAKALAADEQIRRLEAQLDQDRKVFDGHVQKTIDTHDREIAKLAAARDNDVARLTDERDHFKLRYARTVERLHVAGKIVLDALETPIEDTVAREIKENPQINLAAIEKEIAQSVPADIDALARGEPIPAGVTGPKGSHGTPTITGIDHENVERKTDRE